MLTKKARPAYWVLLVILAAHAGLASWYAQITPYRQGGRVRYMSGTTASEIGAPDERQHANYIRHILDGKGLPYLRVDVPDPNNPGKTMRDPALGEEYESHQPPLYYILAARWAKATGIGGVEPNEGGRGLRYPNIVFGALAVLGVYLLCLWGFADAGLALVASAFAALLPMNLALSGAISNDPLFFAICTWSLAVYARGMSSGWTTSMALTAGLLAGLGIWTKASALPLLAALPAAIALGSRQSRYVWAAALIPAFGLAIAWWARTVAVYSPQGYGFDPLGMNVFKDAFADAAPASAFIEAAGPWGYWVDMVGWWTLRSFFGVFGVMDIFMTPSSAFNDPNQTLYRLLAVAFLLLVLGWFLRSRRPEMRQYGKVQAFMLCFLAVNALLLVRFNMLYFQGQARYLFPAIGVFAFIFASGAIYWLRGRWAVALGFVGAGLLALNLYVLMSLLPRAFADRV